MTLEPLDRAEAVRYLGGGSREPDERLSALLSDCEKELISAARPKYLYKFIDLPCAELTRGEDIKAHLEGCRKAAVLCATLGAEVDRLLRVAQVTDMSRAVVLDALAGVAIEQVCGRIDEMLAEQLPELFMTFRFSPGYGDYPLETQKTILALLDAPRRIGLTLNESLLMIPSKSVTAVVGFSSSPLTAKKRGCASCDMRGSCKYRKQGEHCGF